MATNASATAHLDRYQKLSADYRECVVRCQQALDQLEACKRELSEADGDGASVGPNLEMDRAALQLSHRELQVFTLIGQGLTTPEIGIQLGVSVSTVETYRERLKTKLNVHTAPALTRKAVLWLVAPRIEDKR